MAHPHSITAVILAGGRGRRMGGVEKGLLPFAGSTLVEQVLARVKPQVAEVWLSTANPDYARFGLPLLADALPGQQGPLAGLLAALERAESEFVLSVPCDVPHLPADLVVRLARACADAEACCVDDGARLHPVIALWRPQVAPRLRAYLESGERRVLTFYQSLRHAEAPFRDEAAAFANLNTPEELQQQERAP